MFPFSWYEAVNCLWYINGQSRDKQNELDHHVFKLTDKKKRATSPDHQGLALSHRIDDCHQIIKASDWRRIVICKDSRPTCTNFSMSVGMDYIFMCFITEILFLFFLLIALTFDSIKIDYQMSFVTYGVVIPSNVHVEIRICNFLYVLDITSTIYTHQNKTVICFSLACVN